MNSTIEKDLKFDLDYLKILEQDDDCLLVQLDLLHLGENRNMCDISEEAVSISLPTFYNKPIIYRLNNTWIPEYSSDVDEHARNEEQEMQVCIAGTIPESSTVEYVTRNGKTYLRMVGVIHKKYQPILTKILKKRNGNMKVSIEIKALGEVNEKGFLVIERFIFQSVCLLGADVEEGIEGSELEVIAFSAKDYNAHYLNFSRNLVEVQHLWVLIWLSI